MKANDSFIIGAITGVLAFCLLTYILVHVIGVPVEGKKTPGNVSSNIDQEYYLEVSEDSIWIENTQSHRVYGGTYTQLDSLINTDNL